MRTKKIILLMAVLTTLLTMGGCSNSGGNSESADTTTSLLALNVPAAYPTLQEALNNAVEGSTILLAPGTYEVNETLFIDKNNITIASRYLTSGDENDINNTILIGDPAVRLIDGVLGQSANLKIIGLTMTNADKGVTFTDDYGEIHYCNLTDMTHDAISFDSNAGGAVTHCRVERAGDDAIDIDTRHDGSFLIAYNELIDSYDDSIEIHLYNHTGINMHYDIHDNLFSIAGEDGIQLIDYATNTDRTFDIYRNIFEGMGDVGIGSMFEATKEDFLGTAMSERVRIFNNYFYDNGYHITGGDNMIILNNIFEAARTKALYRAKGGSITDHNLFYNNPTDTEDTLTGTHNLYGTDPLKNSDYTLQAGSPAINMGTQSYTHNSEVVLQIPTGDYTGSNPDIGRYEYGLINEAPAITLIGDNPLHLYIGDTFTDPGATAIDDLDGDLTSSIQTVSNVDTSVVGSYTVTYTVTDSDGNNPTISRSVIVTTIPPVITLLGDNPLYINVGGTFTDPGVTATDDIDGDITTSIRTSSNIDTSAVGSYAVTYSVTDSDSNTVAATRSVVVTAQVTDTAAPVITLNGANPIALELGAGFIDPGATAQDDTDGDITPSIQSISNVDTASAGSYTVTYSVSDAAGNSAIASRTVFVKDATIYENAEDGNTIRWTISDNDPAGATISNIYDNDRQSRVIKFEGANTQNGYTFININNTDKIMEWQWKMTYPGENYKFEVKVNTQKGTLHLMYTNYIAEGNTSNYYYYRLADDTTDGTWHSFYRNLEDDIHHYDPDNNLTEIGTIIVKGSLSIDDIMTSGLPATDITAPVITVVGANPMKLNVGDTFSDPGATATDDTDGDITGKKSIAVVSTVDTSTAGTYYVSYSVSDAAGNSATASRDVVVSDSSLATLYEDAKDGNTDGWSVIDNDPAGASITNLYDTDKESRVIELSGSGLDNIFILLKADGVSSWENRTSEIIEWTMKFTEPFEISIKIETLQGTRFLIYTDAATDALGTDKDIYYGLSETARNGTWQTFARNLTDDLKNAQPDNELISIEDFRVRGSGRVDDIKTSGEHSYTPLVRVGYIKRSSEDAAILGDLEAIQYIAPNNEFAIVDDDKYQLYGIDPATSQVTWIMHDSDFGAYTQANPNGYEPLNLTCQKDPVSGNYVGFCDPEAVTYDLLNDDLYLFTGNHPGELTTFKLHRSAADQNFSITDWRRTNDQRTAAIINNGTFYVATVDPVTNEGNVTEYDWGTDTVSTVVFTAAYEIEDLAFSGDILWVLTKTKMLYKFDFTAKAIVDSYDMAAYDIDDPRGVGVINNKLYIADGDDHRTDDLLHAIHIFELP